MRRRFNYPLFNSLQTILLEMATRAMQGDAHALDGVRPFLEAGYLRTHQSISGGISLELGRKYETSD